MNTTKPLFIGHGSPQNAILDNAYTRFLSAYAASIPVPRAVIVISAHWQTKGTFITGSAHPAQIYDFFGFPDELYAVKYAPAGAGDIAAAIAEDTPGLQVDGARGIDHAGWAVVKHMYPAQNVPLLQISLDVHKTEEEHYLLGTKLAKYRDEGLLLIGSGNVVHNLRDISFEDDMEPFHWAVQADAWMKERTERLMIDDLIAYKRTMPNYQRSIPTNEHYLPLLYVMGMRRNGESCRTLHEEIQNGSISMRSLELA